MSQNWPPTRGVRNSDFVNSAGVATPCSSALGPRARAGLVGAGLVGAHSTLEERARGPRAAENGPCK